MSQTLSPSSSVPLAAENYQLKWNSHVTNLNSSISSLYKNDKYADVMLFTCNSDEGYCGIPAHKLILGTCSHYFSSIFDNNPLPINAMLYIVLPPELSRRAVATLIQYMYTGEATVSNDILNEVLKGGEILKIRGLCKVHTGSETFISKPLIDPPALPSYQTYKLMENGSSATTSPLKSNKSTPRNSIDKKSCSMHSDTRSSSTVSHHHVLTQQESPVVVMTTQTNPPQGYAQQQSMNNNNQQQLPQSTTIIVKKDMAIDPGDNNIPVEHYGLISLKIAAAVKKAQQQCMKKSPGIASGPSSSDQRREFYEEALRYDSMQSPPAFKVYTTSASNEPLQQQLQEDDLRRYTEKKKRMVENQKPSSSASSKSNRYVHAENGQQYTASECEKLPQFPEALSFLTIKEEPIDWAEIEGNGQTCDNRTEVITVKPETLDEIESSLSGEVIDKTYSPLTCEVCNLKFQVPAAWVRHIESHSELNVAQQSIPKKRRRGDEQEENMENINILSCDLCENIQFATPGDWVRHVQNTHTETELAMSNNSILMKKTSVRQPKESPSEKSCSICKKLFPSYASMLIHKRTHSAEKTFVCPTSTCNKGFNVKSNLLRHMRSCHNQVASNENQDSDSVD